MGNRDDRKRNETPADARRREPRHPDDVYPDDDPRGAPGDAGEGGQQDRPAAPKDVNPGREYQGTGVPNRSGRFGSSTRPEDLVDEEAGTPEAEPSDRRAPPR